MNPLEVEIKLNATNIDISYADYINSEEIRKNESKHMGHYEEVFTSVQKTKL